MKNSSILFIFLFTGLLITSCEAVKPYEKVYLNDSDMSFSTKKPDRFKENFQSYREGSAGATGGKSGGGCGCN